RNLQFAAQFRVGLGSGMAAQAAFAARSAPKFQPEIKARDAGVVFTPPMSPLAQHHNTLAGIEADIADAERFLADGLAAVIVRLKKGEDTAEAERRVRDVRFTLETLRGLRRQHVRAGGIAQMHRRPEARQAHARG